MESIRIITAFLLSFFSLCHAGASSLAQRDEQCKNLLYQATFAELEYKKRLSLYEEALPLIAFGVSEPIKDAYLTALAGLMKVHDPASAEKNRFLELLLHRVQRVKTLDTRRDQVNTWLTTLAQENENFALKTGENVALYVPSLSGYVRLVQESTLPRWQAGPLPEGAVFPHPSVVCTLESEGSSKGVLKRSERYRLTPKYVQQGTLAVPATGNALGIQFKKSDLDPESIHDADRVQLVITDAGGNRTLHDAWAKIERISPEQLTHMENSHFANQLLTLKVQDDPADALKKIQNLVVLFNDRISHQHKEAVMKEIRALIAKRHRFSSDVARGLRELCATAATVFPSGADRQECKRFIGLLNKDVESQVLNFGDTVMVKTPDQRVLWSSTQQLNNSDGSADVMVTAVNDPRASKGAYLMQIISHAGRTGAVRYGDDVELRPLYGTNGAKLTGLDDHMRLAMTQKEHRGEKVDFLQIAPLHEGTQQPRAVFTLMPHKHLEALGKMGACYVPGDAAYLAHKPSQKMLTINNESVAHLACQFAPQGSAFVIAKPTQSQLQEVAGFYVGQEVVAALNIDSHTGKLSRLTALVEAVRAGIPETAQKKVWLAVQQLYEQREAFSVDEMQQYADFSRAVLPSLSYLGDKQRDLFTVEMNFYERLRIADAKNGAERIAAYQALVPFVTAQAIPENYKTRFLQQLKGLYERKSREFGSLQELMELVVTSTGSVPAASASTL